MLVVACWSVSAIVFDVWLDFSVGYVGDELRDVRDDMGCEGLGDGVDECVISCVGEGILLLDSVG